MEHLETRTYDGRLLAYRTRCSQCEQEIADCTGYMTYSTRFAWWYLEYFCKTCNEAFNVYTRETNAVAKEIALERSLR